MQFPVTLAFVQKVGRIMVEVHGGIEPNGPISSEAGVRDCPRCRRNGLCDVGGGGCR